MRLIPPQYVKPFVKRGKNDSADAEAICEAAGRRGFNCSVDGLACSLADLLPNASPDDQVVPVLVDIAGSPVSRTPMG